MRERETIASNHGRVFEKLLCLAVAEGLSSIVTPFLFATQEGLTKAITVINGEVSTETLVVTAGLSMLAMTIINALTESRALKEMGFGVGAPGVLGNFVLDGMGVKNENVRTGLAATGASLWRTIVQVGLCNPVTHYNYWVYGLRGGAESTIATGVAFSAFAGVNILLSRVGSREKVVSLARTGNKIKNGDWLLSNNSIEQQEAMNQYWDEVNIRTYTI